MKNILSLFLVISCRLAIADCTPIGFPSGHEARKQTIFGGCDYYSLSFRAGYSSEYDGFLGVGIILPFDEGYNWEGHFSDAGLILSATAYKQANIYDLGFISRNGYAFMTTGWEAGLSYKSDIGSNYGIYFGYHFFGLVQARAIKRDFDTEYSIELGIKF